MTTKKTTTKKIPAPIFANIKGKQYETVASRVQRFRAMFPNHSMQSEIKHMDETSILFKTEIRNADGVVIATGHAEEIRGSSMINKTSAVENGETSSWGRALSNLGVDASGEIASFEEVENAIAQQTSHTKKTATKAVSSNKPATDKQKTEIRSEFLKVRGMKEKQIELRRDLLNFANIKLPEDISIMNFKLNDISHLLTEAGAKAFLNRPPF